MATCYITSPQLAVRETGLAPANVDHWGYHPVYLRASDLAGRCVFLFHHSRTTLVLRRGLEPLRPMDT